MSKYLDWIESTRLITEVDSCTTSGDVDYPGTALEITDKSNRDIIHVVVDSTGKRQVMILAQADDYRLPLELLEEILNTAKKRVSHVNG